MVDSREAGPCRVGRSPRGVVCLGGRITLRWLKKRRSWFGLEDAAALRMALGG